MLRVPLLVLALTCLSLTSLAQAPPLWGGLRPGPYSVGYRASYLFDRSRVLTPERDFRGRTNAGDRHRPLLMRVWYPVPGAAGAGRMPYGDYLSVAPGGAPERVVEGLQRRTLDIHQYSIRKYAPQGSGGLFERLMAAPTAVVKDAAPAPGRFPVVVYGGGAQNSTEENTVLWEYLASHGYVVAATPSMGPRSVSSTVDAAGLEAQARDLEFLIAYLHGFPAADLGRLGVMGFSFGGAAALVVAMRNPDVDAVVGFDASFIARRFIPVIRSSPAYDVEGLRVPLLEFHRRDAGTVAYDLTGSLRYSRRYSFDVAGLDHIDFNSYSMLYGAAQGAKAGPNPKLAAKQAAYEEMARYALAFLDAYVKRQGSEEALKAPAGWKGYVGGEVEFRYGEALPAPPSGADLLSLIREEGVSRGERVYRELRRTDPRASVLTEASLDETGYALLGTGEADEALRVFRWNVEAYPNSASAFYGLAQAHEKKGNAACVARAYRKALEVLPSDATTSDSDKETIRRDATEYLKKEGAAAAAGRCEDPVR